jgi:5-methylcytosine-specific restriction endonuclease McrA
MEHAAPSSLAQLSAPALTARLYEIRNAERGLLVEFLAHLAELDRQKLYLEIGFTSTFAFLTDHLGYTRSAAFRRTTAARLVARFPIVSDYLSDGRLCLTTLVELREVLALDEAPLGEILDRAAGRTEEQVRELAAAYRPRPAPTDLLRRLPAPDLVPRDLFSAGPALTPPAPVSAGPALTPAAPLPPPPRIEPISEELRVLRMTVGREFVADLTSLRAALSHQIPDGNLERVLHACIRHMLRHCERRRRGSGKTRGKAPASSEGTKHSRYVPAAVRDEVWRRDEGRCAFVGIDGHRCGSTHMLELHHIVPFAKGGPSTAPNLTLTCAVHNRFLAERDYGARAVARAVAKARRARDPSSSTDPARL